MDEEMQEAPRQQAIQPPTFKAPKMVSRPKPPVQQEEELGAEPKLGDFEGEHALSISEARAVVTAIHARRRQMEPGSNPLGGDRVHNDSQSIQQFVDYLDMFARYKQTENLHSMGGIFDSNPQINPIERAMLGSLCPDTADEAKTLIPSLATKFEDETLQPILDELQKLRTHELINPSDVNITQAYFSARGSLWIDTSIELWLFSWAQRDARQRIWLRAQAKAREEEEMLAAQLEAACLEPARQDSVEPLTGEDAEEEEMDMDD